MGTVGKGGGIDEVLARVASDPQWAEELARAPRAALAVYDLSTEDLVRLADELDRRRSAQAGESGPPVSLRAVLTGEADPADD